MTKNAFSKAKKIAMKFFGSEMTPPPPHPFCYTQASLRREDGKKMNLSVGQRWSLWSTKSSFHPLCLPWQERTSSISYVSFVFKSIFLSSERCLIGEAKFSEPVLGILCKEWSSNTSEQVWDGQEFEPVVENMHTGCDPGGCSQRTWAEAAFLRRG